MARILLVDDETAVRQLFADVLEIDAHAVTQAGDGNGALAALEHGAFDLVVTDLVMPDKEGIETIIEMRKRWPTLPVVAMSGGGRGSAADYLELAAQLGAVATLQKPFATQVLLDTVRKVLDR
ncbi:MAG: response regulator [Gemmatimonadetes bacterium]|nr:response regulator [Gemmatimonadota bacterium]